MKKISLIVLALVSVYATNVFAAKAVTAGSKTTANRAAVTITNPTTGAYDPLTVANSLGTPSGRAAWDVSCDAIGATEPDVKVSGSNGVNLQMYCHSTAGATPGATDTRGIGVASQHTQGRPKACGAAKDKACVYGGTTAGGKTMAVDAAVTVAGAAQMAACAVLLDTSSAASTCP